MELNVVLQALLAKTSPTSLVYTKTSALNMGDSRTFLVDSETLIFVESIIVEVL